MSVFYANIDQAVSDKYVTQPLPTVSLRNPFAPVNWGPRTSTSASDQYAPHLELFNKPVFQPDPNIVPASRISNQGTGNVPDTCPATTLLLRNHWETYNTTSGKYFGGFDPYSIQNVPSCVERSGAHMNFMDFATNPWARTIVEQRGDEMAIDSHGGTWSDTVPRWQEARENGVYYM
jgi:hypothetical protein